MSKLYAVEVETEDEEEVYTDFVYIWAPSLETAIQKWKSFEAARMNEELRESSGRSHDHYIPSQIHDPLAIAKIASLEEGTVIV